MQELMCHIYDLKNERDQLQSKLDKLVVGNLTAQHRAAMEGTRLRKENAALREAARRLLAQMPPAVFKSAPETLLSLWGIEPTVADAIVLHDAFHAGKE